VKIRIDRDALADAVTWTSRALSSAKAGGNIGIGIEAKGDSVVFTAYDRDTSARAEYEAVVEQAGSCVVPARLLNDITKTLPSAPVVITQNNNNLDVQCGRSSFNLPTITAGEFPKMIEVPDLIGSITGEDLATAVGQVHIAAETNESLPNLTGIQIEFLKGFITLAATDRYRLALRDVSWTPAVNDPDTSVLVPASRLNDIAKGLADANKIEISLSNTGENKLIGFSGNGKSITTALLGYSFPKYRDTIPAPGPITAYIETSALSAALKRVRLVLDDQQKYYVALELGDGEVSLITQGAMNGAANEAIDAHVDSTLDEAARFDPNRFIDGLSALNAPYVKLSFISAARPLLITAAKEPGVDIETGYKYWLMPKPAAK
jgi:DNA polymerase-3 subunit beta